MFLCERLQETRPGATITFTVDLQAGLSQVLSDGAHTYLYGNGRIAQQDAAGRSYFLGDALGSVRQVVNAQGVVTLARSYALSLALSAVDHFVSRKARKERYSPQRKPSRTLRSSFRDFAPS